MSKYSYEDFLKKREIETNTKQIWGWIENQLAMQSLTNPMTVKIPVLKIMRYEWKDMSLLECSILFNAVVGRGKFGELSLTNKV